MINESEAADPQMQYPEFLVSGIISFFNNYCPNNQSGADRADRLTIVAIKGSTLRAEGRNTSIKTTFSGTR